MWRKVTDLPLKPSEEQEHAIAGSYISFEEQYKVKAIYILPTNVILS